jgi:hypothetical protein
MTSAPLRACRIPQIPAEPAQCESRNLLQRARFFKEVARSGDDRQLLLAAHLLHGLTVQFDYLMVIAANDEQRRRLNASQGGACEIRPASPGNDGRNDGRLLSGGDQCCPCTGARSEVTHAEIAGGRFSAEPVGDLAKPGREKADIEAQMSCTQVDLFFGFREQVEQQRPEAASLEHGGHVAIARTVPAAAATVGKQNDSCGSVRDHQVPG